LRNNQEQSVKPLPAFLGNGVSFLKRQQRDWKVTVLRTSLDKLAYQMVFPYLSIYIVALGATGTQLGMVNGIGMIIAGFFGPFTGWFIDRIGPKKIYLIGIGFIAVSYLIYGLAQNWGITIIAMVAYWLGFSTSAHSCATICGTCLVNRDRATGMLICETVAAGLLGMAGPMLARREISEMLEVPPEVELFALLPVGYPAEEPTPGPRKPLEEIVRVIE